MNEINDRQAGSTMSEEARRLIRSGQGSLDLQGSECPKCGALKILKWSGVMCSSCDWWYCA